jgi:hypothetical protein
MLNNVEHPEHVKINAEWSVKHIGLEKSTPGALPSVSQAAKKQVHAYNSAGTMAIRQHSQHIPGSATNLQDTKATRKRPSRAAQSRFDHPIAGTEPKVVVLCGKQRCE